MPVSSDTGMHFVGDAADELIKEGKETFRKGAAGGNMGSEFETWVERVEALKPNAWLIVFYFDQ